MEVGRCRGSADSGQGLLADSDALSGRDWQESVAAGAQSQFASDQFSMLRNPLWHGAIEQAGNGDDLRLCREIEDA